MLTNSMAHYFEWRYAFISLFFGGLFVAYLFFFPQSIFAANEVSITEDTTLVLPSDGSEYTLASGAQFDSLTINDDNFEFVMSSGGTATLSSSARRVFVTGDIDKSTTCSTDTSSIVVELDSGDSNGKKIFIRPSSETCPGSGGSVPTNSGGSSSGGGTGTTGSSPAAPSAPSQVEQQVTETPSLPILPVLPSGQTISALFSVGVGLGMTHSDIQRLQQLLNTDPDTRIADSGVGSPGNETNFFGSLTEKAVQKFQKKYGVALEGDPGFGFVGPKTRVKLQEVFGGEAPALAPTPPSLPSSSAPITISSLFAIGLGNGMQNADIQRLQQLLNTDPDTRIADSGVGSPGNETNFFGSLTEKAVQKFQKKYGVALEGDPGFGFVGPKTRVKLQEVFGGIMPDVSIPPSVEVPSSSSATDTATVQAQIDAAQAQLNLLLQQLEALSQ